MYVDYLTKWMCNLVENITSIILFIYCNQQSILNATYQVSISTKNCKIHQSALWTYYSTITKALRYFKYRISTVCSTACLDQQQVSNQSCTVLVIGGSDSSVTLMDMGKVDLYQTTAKYNVNRVHSISSDKLYYMRLSSYFTVARLNWFFWLICLHPSPRVMNGRG